MEFFTLMKYRISIICILLLLVGFEISAQKIGLGVNYTSSNAYFLKNVPGVGIFYEHQIQKNFLFIDFNAAYKNNAYTELAGGGTELNSYLIIDATGTLFLGSMNLGFARNLISSESYSISLGGFIGLNYLFRNENKTYLNFDTVHPGRVTNSTFERWNSNKFGFGLLLDMEIKQIIIDQLSLFSRIEVAHTNNDPVVRGLSFEVFSYNSISFSLGLKYNLKKNTSP